ncbi:MAG: excinuclease ABC subunit UvrA [Bacteroidales bacterium]|nr:excinuclease ABC subunit UvrA [Bacteroidales bacterium]
MDTNHSGIVIRDAFENNLKHISLSIPKYCITVFTGVSGSGKSSLVLDTVAATSRRALNDTFSSFVQQYLPKYGRPHVGSIENLPIAVVIDQKKPAPNSRSTVGTYTDIYSLVRLLFSRVGKPFVGYSDSFSFNNPQGCCPRCSGLGEIRELDIHKLVDFDKSLNDEDTIHYIAFGKGGWRWIRYANSGLFDLDKKIRDYSPEELDLFLNSPQIRLKNPPSNWPKSAKYEGLIPRMYRSIINSEEGLLHAAVLNPMLNMGVCPDCGGTRLNPKVLSCRIEGKNIAEVCDMSISRLAGWIGSLSDPLAADLKKAIGERLGALEEIGLGYLSLSRPVGTLSGGEAQRCKIAKYINSPLSDVLYILDEPSVGLHNADIELMKKSVCKLRDAGNTVLLVEHHREMIKTADYIVDMGPGAGMLGGEILFEGTYPELLRSGTDTGRMMGESLPMKEAVRTPSGFFRLEGADIHNLRNVSIDLPLGVFAAVAGVAGSGKSSLLECFRNSWPRPEEIVYISQKNIGASLRSTPATYMDVAGDIRKMFARACKVKEEYFTFNGKGACPVCGGKGVIVSEMAFMDSIETVCEACGGLRYSPEALRYRLRSEATGEEVNIAQAMDLTVRLASIFFAGTAVEEKLRPMMDVGLGYLHLNQALSTLSGGELQRLKMASSLGVEGKVFIIDEPTDGLHMKDVRHLLGVFDALVDKGNSVFVIEHNTDVLRSADYIIEMGPGAGENGGRVIFAGTPQQMLACPGSVTAAYL